MVLWSENKNLNTIQNVCFKTLIISKVLTNLTKNVFEFIYYRNKMKIIMIEKFNIFISFVIGT